MSLSSFFHMMMGNLDLQPFQTTFAVPLHCDSCIQSITTALKPLPGINSINADLTSQLVHVTGTTPPSKIVDAIQSTGRDAILRGSGRPNSAAVCILETGEDSSVAVQSRSKETVKGLARMVQVSDGGSEKSGGSNNGNYDTNKDGSGGGGSQKSSRSRTLVDLVVNGLTPGTYQASIRKSGDISRGVASAGEIWDQAEAAVNGHSPSLPSSSSITGRDDNNNNKNNDNTNANNDDGHREAKGQLGTLKVASNGSGSAFLQSEITVAEVVGRAMMVLKHGTGIPATTGGRQEKLESTGQQEKQQREKEEAEAEESASASASASAIIGVIARSAGVWENDKTVCSCSGKTIWQERKEQQEKGVA